MLSRSSAYAISALAYLASQNDERWTLCQDVARALSLPSQYLARLLRVLSARRVLESQRGRNGGFRLGRPAAEIMLMEIVDPFDHLRGQRACFFGFWNCSTSSPCPLHSRWKPISDAYERLLNTTSLADLVNTLESRTRRAEGGEARPWIPRSLGRVGSMP
jgi:Rrf2 family protein